MEITVKVIPGARKNFLKEENGGLKVYLTTPPVDGRANEALVKFLAAHFRVNTSRIRLVRGQTARTKTIAIEGL